MPNDAKPGSGRIMRMPVSGGPAEPLFNVQGYATWGSPGDVARNLGDVPGFRCPTTRGASCVLTESSDGDEKHLIITPFDPSQGKKGAPTKLEFPDDPEWALSPDGSQLAFTWFDTQSATVRIMPVGGGASHDISIKGLSELVGAAWASDGKSLFVIQNSSKGGLIYHVNFNGDSQTLFRGSWDILQLAPSPDGHYLAYGAVNSNSNVWMIPSLPKP